METTTEKSPYKTYKEMWAALKAQGIDCVDPDEQEREIQERIAAGTITVNELRDLRCLRPIPGGDVQVKDYVPATRP